MIFAGIVAGGSGTRIKNADKPKQFIGTSIVVRTFSNSRALVERSVLDGFEPHFVVIKGLHARTLETLAERYGFEVCRY